MSLRLQLLQGARLSPRLLGDSTALVREFFPRRLSPAGAALDRDGRPDLYYSIVALAGLQALDAEVPKEKSAQNGGAPESRSTFTGPSAYSISSRTQPPQ